MLATNIFTTAEKATFSGAQPDDHWIKRFLLVQESNALLSELIFKCISEFFCLCITSYT